MKIQIRDKHYFAGEAPVSVPESMEGVTNKWDLFSDRLLENQTGCLYKYAGYYEVVYYPSFEMKTFAIKYIKILA